VPCNAALVGISPQRFCVQARSYEQRPCTRNLRIIRTSAGSGASYAGQPFHDQRYAGGPQVIPGKVQCAYYDAGGEGVAYHDSDAVNHGSGELNPLDGSYLHGFRVREGVDIFLREDRATASD
jgi:hypothetical protein